MPDEIRSQLPNMRSADTEHLDCPSGTGIVLAVLSMLSLWAMLAAVGVTLW